MPADPTRYADLLEAIRKVSSNLDNDQVLHFIIDAATRLMNADSGSVVLVDEDDKSLYFAAVGNEEDRQMLQEIRIAPGEGVVGWCVSKGEPVIVHNVATDKRFSRSVDNQTGFQTKSLICVPLKNRDQVIGALELLNPADLDALDDGEMDLLSAFATQAAVAIGNARDYEKVVRERSVLRDQLSDKYRIVSRSRSLDEVLRVAGKAARADSTVLIEGESGTGKELIARTVHTAGPRADLPFVAVNCASLSTELLESELFGHEKGAFTGAHARKAGKFEVAAGGTFFLDEIGEMQPELQARLLRVLQERVFERVGGTRPIPFKCRLVCATNRNLAKAVAAGNFRQDLYFRLNVITIHVPPLRARTEDIPPLIERFMDQCNRRIGSQLLSIDDAALECMLRYPWPGNVRELEHIIERISVLSEHKAIRLDDLPIEIRTGRSPVAESDEVPGNLSFKEAVREMKRQLLTRTIAECGGNQRQAAARLDIQPSYLSRLLLELGLRGERD
jgi:Nif-specific regulatory protein